jgi:hypothetical protein
MNWTMSPASPMPVNGSIAIFYARLRLNYVTEMDDGVERHITDILDRGCRMESPPIKDREKAAMKARGNK